MLRFTITFMKPEGRTDWFEVISFWLDKSRTSFSLEGDEFELGIMMDRIAQTKWMGFLKQSDLNTITLLEAYHTNKMIPWMELSFDHHKDQTTYVKRSLLFSNVAIDSIKPRVRQPYFPLTPNLPDIDVISILADETAVRSEPRHPIIIKVKPPRRRWPPW